MLARRILLVEDESLSRSLIAGLLSDRGFWVEAVGTAVEAMALLEDFDPDALVVDLDLGEGPGGAQLIQAVSQVSPHVRSLILTGYAVSRDVARRLPTGVVRLDKRELSRPDALPEALDRLLRGELPRESASKTPLDQLSPRQSEVLRLVAAGMSNAEIAASREMSVRGVEASIRRIFEALGIRADDPSINARVAAARIYIRYAGLPSDEVRT